MRLRRGELVPQRAVLHVPRRPRVRNLIDTENAVQNETSLRRGEHVPHRAVLLMHQRTRV